MEKARYKFLIIIIIIIIKGLMNTRDMWDKRAMKTNEKLHLNAYRHFRKELNVKSGLPKKIIFALKF